MAFPGCSLFNPSSEQSFVVFRQVLPKLRGRHSFVVFGRFDATNHFARIWIARDNGARFVGNSVQTLKRIEASLSLPFVLVRAMTCKTSIRKNRPDIAVKFDAIW